MQVGDLVRWADCQVVCGIVLETWGDHPNNQEVLVWFSDNTKEEWCMAYDLEVICKSET